MALLLRYEPHSSVPVELDSIIPDRLRSQSLADIERIPVHHGNTPMALAELFSIHGDPSDGRIELEGNLSSVHRIGERMTTGTIHVIGNVGRHVGSQMSGGKIHIQGNAGDWLGAEMSGGLIDVNGQAGDHIGSVYPGGRRGMTDGTILVRGDAGAEVGSRMRRGMIVIEGSCDRATGLGMIAGSILVFGRCGSRAGAEMRRGTIVLFAADHAELLPTFGHSGQFQPVFLSLIVRELARLGFELPQSLLARPFDLYRGDGVVHGKGEVWLKSQ